MKEKKEARAKKKNKRNPGSSKGLVSVFLAIILVPCMVFTCVFGDLSRVQLSKATAASAGDLALYSLMSHYDEKLKEYYGLVASCQNIDEFYDKTQKYFVGMMAAEGVPDEGSKLFVEYLNNLKEGGYSDFLRCEITEPKIEAAANGALGTNPALIEDGIVEFMKYRGPVTVTSNLIDRFADLDLEKQSKEIEENKEVSDAKQNYAEKQGDLLKSAFATYLAIRRYEKSQEDTNIPSQGMYQKAAADMQHILDDLKAVTKLITLYYYPGTENLQSMTIPTFDLSDDDYTAKAAEDIGEETTNENGETVYCVDSDMIADLTEDLDTQIEDITDAADAFVSAMQSVPDPGNGNNGINAVVYCMKTQQVIADTDLITTMSKNGDKVMKTWANLLGAMECEPKPEGSNLPDDWKDTLQEKCDDIEEVYDKYLGGETEPSKYSDYYKICKKYTSISLDTVPKVKNKSYTFDSAYLGKKVTVGEFAQAAASQLLSWETSLQDQIDKLTIAIDGGTLNKGEQNEREVSSLDDLLKQVREFASSRENWGNAAKAHNTDYAQSEQALYNSAAQAGNGGNNENPEVEGERIAAEITPDSVAELKQRLTNIRSDMQACRDSIVSLTYGGKPLASLSSAEALIGAATQSVIPKNEHYQISEGESLAKGYYSSLVPAADGVPFQAPSVNNAKNGNNPSLSSNTPELYAFLKEKLQDNEDEVDEKISENDKKNKQYKDDANTKKDNSKELSEEIQNNLGSDLSDCRGNIDNADRDNKKVGLLSGIGSVASIVSNVANGTGDELRDQIYVCEYIMDMFSYSGFDTEGMNRLAIEENKTPQYPYSEQKEAWEKEDTYEVMRNQSLTNRPINKAHNKANLGEVEYILYGNTQIKENLKSSYGNILAIREASNAVSAFVNFYSAASKNPTAVAINGVADAIASATYGIVPIPVTKCVLIVALATLESAVDLGRLKKGEQVKFYKSADDWVCAVTDSNPNASFDDSMGKNANDENGMYYSDYMYIFLLMGLTNEKTYPSMLLRVGDLIQANMRMGDKAIEGFDLSKSICYYDLKATVRVKPLMLTLPIVDTVEGAGDLREKTDWCTYKVDLIRGYS